MTCKIISRQRLINENLRKEFQDIQRKCIKFANDNIAALKNINPSLPDKLNDRAADNWYILFQIATLAGQQCLKYTIEAALSLSGVEQENKSLGIELLEDILNLFDGKFKDKEVITTFELITSLSKDEEAPWGTYNSKRQDTKITPKQLASLLKPYEIKSINNVGYAKQKGYSKVSFQDAFSRYIYAEEPDFAATSATSAPPNDQAGSSENEDNNYSATSRSTCSHNESSPKSNVAGSAYSRSERIKSTAKQVSETASNLSGADRADKSARSGANDYMDV